MKAQMMLLGLMTTGDNRWEFLIYTEFYHFRSIITNLTSDGFTFIKEK